MGLLVWRIGGGRVQLIRVVLLCGLKSPVRAVVACVRQLVFNETIPCGESLRHVLQEEMGRYTYAAVSGIFNMW